MRITEFSGHFLPKIFSVIFWVKFFSAIFGSILPGHFDVIFFSKIFETHLSISNLSLHKLKTCCPVKSLWNPKVIDFPLQHLMLTSVFSPLRGIFFYITFYYVIIFTYLNIIKKYFLYDFPKIERKVFLEKNFKFFSKKSDFFVRNHTIDIYIRRNINLKHEIQTH